MKRETFNIFILMFLVGSLLFTSSCSDTEEVTQIEIKRLQAHNDIQNLMGRYAFYHTSGLNFMAAQKLFATYDDTVIEMMWGRYTGKDAAYRAYTVAHRIYDLPAIKTLKLDAPEVDISSLETDSSQGVVSEGVTGTPAVNPPSVSTAPADTATGTTPVNTPSADTSAPASSGNDEAGSASLQSSPVSTENRVSLNLNALTTPVIEVAGDCETARAVWVCPGMEGMQPVWVKYACDFKKQDGEWKIWHLHVYGLLTGLEAKETFTPNTAASRGADKPPTTNWEYSNTTKYIPYEPEPPQPYDTWSDTIQPKSYGDPN